MIGRRWLKLERTLQEAVKGRMHAISPLRKAVTASSGRLIDLERIADLRHGLEGVGNIGHLRHECG